MTYYEIAGLIFAIDDTPDFPYMNKRMSAYKTDRRDTADIAVHYKVTDEPLTLPDNCSGYDVGLFTYFDCDTPEGRKFGYYSRLDDGRVANLITMDELCREVHIDIMHMDFEGVDDPDGRRIFNSIGNVAEIGMPLHSRLVFHSSSICFGGKGICFSAASGTGKSTHTALWQEVYGDRVTLVNDDKPIIRLDTPEPVLAGTPWAGTTGLNTNVSVPLAAIVVIERAEENSLARLDEITAVHRIIKESPKPVIPEITGLFLDRINELITKTPVYCLKCNISHDAVKCAGAVIGL